ncbi:3-oxoacyl-[acyl-carrier-protein] reductase FabG-like [Rhopilema esculentum]|uniref:3-oxoacyl-[acyl-carrier-protein] reductase FabG-like n=1 Tax=Rhopilema esculentum TaxID=499914 RepID=UPI0031CDDBAB|eukprot:gene17458-9063_t
MSSLDGKVAIITGASSGLGKATAILFAEFGAKLVLTGRNGEALNKTKSECLEKNKNISEPLCIQGDLTDEEHVKDIIKKTIDHFKCINVLVNNAGIVVKGTVENTTMEQFDKIMNINVRSVFHLTHLAVPYLIETKGSIVNVSSVNGMRAFAGVNAYCMTKSAIDQFTRCTALELASKQVRCNSVNPGVIKTEIHQRGGMDAAEYAKFLEHSKTTHALGRVGEPIEVAKTIAFLASDDSSFITGASIPIDGGRHAMCPR